MSKFSWWEATDSVQHDYDKGENLTTDEAQVLATLKIAEELADTNAILKDLLYLFQRHPLEVVIKDK